MRVIFSIVGFVLLIGCAREAPVGEAREMVAASVSEEDREIVAREIARRRARMVEAEAAMREGDALMDGGDVEGAREFYRRAVDLGR